MREEQWNNKVAEQVTTDRAPTPGTAPMALYTFLSVNCLTIMMK